ncbi:hypothetical protein BGX21_000023 [Mortierella sp. AD011]|nr:hypothetical protein BGX20_001702 [Mortierella sp. AD010]KAF9404077.1 hypothetical protein BGX21_000023 [Mortierella sp. AD011]
MQALVVIDKAKEHDYMREFSKNPSLAMNVTRRHLQDLYLVEYCCRFVCAHENQLGNIDIVDTLEHLNSTVLESVRAFRIRVKTEYKTTFQLNQDPLLDYTLAILTKSWNELSSDLDYRLPSQGFSPEQTALAFAASPFLRALMNRRLFPSTTLILHNIARDHGSVSSSRRAILEMYLSNSDQKSSMQWIWLWDRRDPQDWQDQWTQPEFQQWLVEQIFQSNRPDWIIDLFRLTSKASGAPHTWIRDLLAATPDISRSVMAKENRSLEGVLRLSDMDAEVFSNKKQYYNFCSWRHSDHLQSWLSGLQEPSLVISHRNHVVEHILWREMAMIGAFSRVMSREDIINSLNPTVIATISPSDIPLQHQPFGSFPGTSSSSDKYHDTLTDYLDEKAIESLKTCPIQPDNSLSQMDANQNSPEAFTLLKRAIQEVMSQYHAEDKSSQTALDTYRNLLHDIVHNAAFRLGYMDLVSQATEARFYALYGEHVWNKVVSTSRDDTASNSNLDDGPTQEHRVLDIPEVRDFVTNHLRLTVAKMSASRILTEGSPIVTWEGKLSDWFMAVAKASPITGPMARNLQYKAYLKPGTHAYDHTLKTLLEYHELDLAANLHSHAYGLTEISGLLKTGAKRPAVKEVETIIHKLATSDKDPHHLERAQWIFDQHLKREHALAESGRSFEKRCVVDIQIVTELVGAWCRRAQFMKARDVVKVMWDQGIQPNMIFYNTMLKSLMDLAPYSKTGGRSMGSGKRPGMRELGREIMVRQLLRSRAQSGDGEASEDDVAKIVRSELDFGWDLLQDVISTASERQARRIHLPAYGVDSPSMLKSLITQTISWSQRTQSSDITLDNGQFMPDAYTFSILLGAFANRGEIESISELFVEMKRLNLEPDAVICSILANAFAKKGDLRALDRVIQEARARYIDPGLYLANVVLDSLVEKGVSASKIRETLDGMITGILASGDQNVDTDDDTEIPVRRIGTTAHGHHRIGTQKRAGVASNGLTDKSLEPSLKVEPGLDAVTLTTLIKYHSRQNDIGAALDMIQLMVQAGFVPDNRVYVLLIAASIRKQDIVAGISTMQAIRVYSKMFPDAKAWKGLLRCAMELEKQGLMAAKQQHPSEFLSRPSGPLGPKGSGSSANEVIQQQQREEPVFFVLKELSNVLDEIEAEAAVNGKQAGDASKEYLLKILTTSWISLSENSINGVAESCGPHVDGGSMVMSLEVKGKNGLLRRLLNHMLRVQQGSRKRSRRSSKQDQQPQKEDLELAAEIEQRCEHAIWLVRLVESHGIELGQRWMWDVVIPRIQSLTQRNPGLIMKQLGGARRYPRRNRKQKKDTLEKD